MNNELFGQPYDRKNPYWILESFFDRMHGEGYFIKTIIYIIGRNSFHLDGAYCSFPDLNSCYEEDHFEGIEYAYGYPPENDSTIIVSENICSKYIKIACAKYLNLHPEDSAEIQVILQNSLLDDS